MISKSSYTPAARETGINRRFPKSLLGMLQRRRIEKRYDARALNDSPILMLPEGERRENGCYVLRERL